MAYYAIAMAGIAAVLQRSGRRPAIDLVLKSLEHFAAITRAMGDRGLWNDAHRLYYDRLLAPGRDRRTGQRSSARWRRSRRADNSFGLHIAMMRPRSISAALSQRTSAS
jgi:hypothetical protein